MRRLFVAAMLLGGLGIAGFVALVVYAGGVGGVSASYRARDGDLLLTQVARTATPAIAALARFYEAQQRYPDPADDQDLARVNATLPAGAAATRIGGSWLFKLGAGSGWMYHRAAAEPRACTLSIKLGWDPRLTYSVSENRGRWVFVPGDGREEQTIVLSP